MSVYEELGVKRVVNAGWALTRLGGSRLPEEVQRAMEEANKSYCDMWALHLRAGEVISQITGAEAAFVTPGAFAGLVLCAAACIAGKDPEKMRRLPDSTGMRNEIIIQRSNRHYVYDRSIEVPGGRMVLVGDERWGCPPEVIEGAITEKTAAIHYLAPISPRRDVASIEEVVRVAHDHDVPIIVDASGMTWPLDGLRRFASMGCDLVCYGGKYIEGPNSTGFVVGRKDLIEALALHSFIGAETGPLDQPGYWRSIGRGYKLDRQEVVGLIAALRRWVNIDHEAVRFKPAWEKTRYIEGVIRGLRGLKGARLSYIPRSGEGCGPHIIGLQLAFEDRTEAEVEAVVMSLRRDDPEVWVAYSPGRGGFLVNSLWLAEGEERIVAERFKRLMG